MVRADLAEVHAGTRDVYVTEVATWDTNRRRDLYERVWLDRWLEGVAPGAALLDLGCGAGEPIAAHLIGRGFDVTGADYAPAMLARARARHPDARWVEADMRTLDLGRTFAGILGWDSFFHLSPDEQRAALPRIAGHLEPGGAMMLTVGPVASERVGTGGGRSIYHASLSPEDYEESCRALGFARFEIHLEADAAAGRTVLLAQGWGGA